MSNAIGIYYGTTSGSTEAAANMIKEVMVRLHCLTRLRTPHHR